MPAYNEDGYLSATLGDRQARTQTQPLDHSMLYSRGGIYARVIDLPADTAMSRGIEVEGDEDRIIRDELDRLDVVGNMSDALRWSRLDGGAALLLLTDTGTLDEPLGESFGRINEVRIVEMSQLAVAPGGYYNDPNNANYGEPELYQVTPIGGSGVLSVNHFYAHESRVLPVYGDPLPARMRISSIVPWAGRPAATAAFESIRKYERSLYLSLEIMKRKQQAVHKMKGLAELIQNNMESMVRKRVDLVDEVRSLLNGVAVDADDDYVIYDQNVSGLKDLIAEYQVAVSADSGIPVTQLFGRSAAGMNSTGENDLEGLYDLCEGLQKTSAQPALERLIDAILRQSSLTGTKPQKWRIHWPSLWTPTDAQKAETADKEASARLKNAQARQIDADTGAVTNEEARTDIIGEGRYSIAEE